MHPSPGTSPSHLPRSPCRLIPTTSTPGAPLPLCPCLVQAANCSLPASSHHPPAVQPLPTAAPFYTILVTLPYLLSPQPNPHPSNPHTPWVFRRNSATDSDSIRPLIPTQTGHLFRTNSATLRRVSERDRDRGQPLGYSELFSTVCGEEQTCPGKGCPCERSGRYYDWRMRQVSAIETLPRAVQ